MDKEVVSVTVAELFEACNSDNAKELVERLIDAIKLDREYAASVRAKEQRATTKEALAFYRKMKENATK